MRPVLAGRDAERVEPLAERLDCPARVFALQSPERIARQLSGVQAVLNCAGPFSKTAAPMIDACLRSKVHYLDITGEIEVIESAAARHDQATAAGIAVIPAVGFDVVPSDCLAAMLARKLPGATHLELAFDALNRPSRGTAKTMLEGLPRGGRARVGGKIVEVPVGWKTMTVPFRDGPRAAVTIPWGDVASAYYSTGIPNIEVYLSMPQWQIQAMRLARPLLPVLRTGAIQGGLGGLIDRFVRGPSEQQEADRPGSFWGRARDDQGREVSATLLTPAGYLLTVLTALACVERLLGGSVAAGFATPSKAFGTDFILSIPGTSLRWEQEGPLPAGAPGATTEPGPGMK
jgi:short subunit dehydrogenase-like uncharacterized protein